MRVYKYQRDHSVVGIQAGDRMVQARDSRGYWRNIAGPFSTAREAEKEMERIICDMELQLVAQWRRENH